ncbi:hypothetical protein C5N99_01880 [Treponema medium]|nr:hypothetical protein C5N99_01880 [Treponema medium]
MSISSSNGNKRSYWGYAQHERFISRYGDVSKIGYFFAISIEFKIKSLYNNDLILFSLRRKNRAAAVFRNWNLQLSFLSF